MTTPTAAGDGPGHPDSTPDLSVEVLDPPEPPPAPNLDLTLPELEPVAPEPELDLSWSWDGGDRQV